MLVKVGGVPPPMSTWNHWPLVWLARVDQRVLMFPSMALIGEAPLSLADALATQPTRLSTLAPQGVAKAIKRNMRANRILCISFCSDDREETTAGEHFRNIVFTLYMGRISSAHCCNR